MHVDSQMSPLAPKVHFKIDPFWMPEARCTRVLVPIHFPRLESSGHPYAPVQDGMACMVPCRMAMMGRV